MKIKDITNYIEQIAPLPLQESYDNSGLLVGNKEDELTGALITLDCTEEIIEEAIKTNCNLIIAHHPIIFSGLKKITGKNYVERTVINAIKNDIAIYACHTNLDNVKTGVNKKIANKLNLVDTGILVPKSNLEKIVIYCPIESASKIKEALGRAGAGQIGNYKDCSFQTPGTGNFTPNEHATPHTGQAMQPESVEELKIEAIYPSHLRNKVINAAKKVHPYEEMAYFSQSTLNKNQDTGAGMTGYLRESLSAANFLDYLKKCMDLQVIRHTPLVKNEIKKVAICGGSGSFLLGAAKGVGADIFITGDFKYHEFFDAENDLIIADIGHYESEVFTKELFYELLSEKFANIAVRLSNVNTNPVHYY